MFIPIGILVADNRTSVTSLAVSDLLRILGHRFTRRGGSPDWDSTHSEITHRREGKQGKLMKNHMQTLF